MEVKLGKLIEAIPAVKRLMGEKMSGKQAYQLSRLARLIETEAASFEEARKGLLEKYGKKQDDETWQIPPENGTEFVQEFQELISVPVQVEISPITLDGIQGVTPADMLALDFFISEA